MLFFLPLLVSSLTTPTSKENCALLKSVNEFRTDYGLKPLVGDVRLDQSAMKHCLTMGRYQELDHELGSTHDQRAKQAGYVGNGYAENIYRERGHGPISAQRANQAWIDSPGHRKNMLGKNHQSVGYASCIGSDGRSYYDEQFGSGDVTSEFSYTEESCGYSAERNNYQSVGYRQKEQKSAEHKSVGYRQKKSRVPETRRAVKKVFKNVPKASRKVQRKVGKKFQKAGKKVQKGAQKGFKKSKTAKKQPKDKKQVNDQFNKQVKNGTPGKRQRARRARKQVNVAVNV